MSYTLDNHVKAYEGECIYDFDNSILLNWYPKRVMALAKRKGSLLELGLGHGFSTENFHNQYERYLVLEGSPAVIDNFRKRHPNCPVEIIETYFEDFKTSDKFDVIVLGFILEHVENPQQILKHYSSFLKPGGDMFVTVPNAEVLNRRLGYHAGLLSNLQELSENDYIQGHKRYYTLSSLTEELKTAGYSIESIEGIYLKPFTTSQMLSLNLNTAIINALCEVGLNYPELSCGLLAHTTFTT